MFRADNDRQPPLPGRPPRQDHSDLALPESLLIKPIRLWLHGAGNWPLVVMQYRAHFGGGRGALALMSLKSLIETLNAGGRRCLEFRRAHCTATTGDERALVALGAALQAGDAARAGALAERLVTADFQPPLVKAMTGLMATFRDRGHRLVHLPLRGRPAAASPLSVAPGGEGRRRPAPASRR